MIKLFWNTHNQNLNTKDNKLDKMPEIKMGNLSQKTF